MPRARPAVSGTACLATGGKLARIPGLLGVADLEMELSDLFGRRKVDLRTPEDLSRWPSAIRVRPGVQAPQNRA